MGPVRLMRLAGSADLSLVVNAPERADAPDKEHRVEASMGDQWQSQVLFPNHRAKITGSFL
jgi:hypothetical protein